MPYFLSKSDFKIAHDCPTKLYYKKKGYPNLKDKNEYLQHLARGGYMVGKLATLLYPSGILIDTGTDHEKAIKQTNSYLQKENVTLFEAAIECNRKLIRVDILEKQNKKVNLIEVKSKSYESTSDENKQKKIIKDLEEYIVDVAFQYFVIKEAYSEWEVTPFLYLPDKAKNTRIDGLISFFEIKEVIIPDSRFRKYDVTFDDKHLGELLNDDLMTLVDVTSRVLELQPQIKEETDKYLTSLNDKLEKIIVPLNKECFKCEYNLTNEEFPLGGYDECWKDYPKVDHHISELYYIGSIGGYKNPLADQLINQKKISLSDFPIESLKEGSNGNRQKIQIKYTLENDEWISEELKNVLKGLNYPLHFIDFETTSPALPFKIGMRPYEPIVFQWSCHTVKEPNAKPIHNEWICLEPEFPNFLFAESLMKVLGEDGTALMWSPYENTMLRTIYDQMGKYEYKNNELKEWIERIVKFNKDDEGRLVDLNKIALQCYFHPLMKGKTSIKWTLPAVLSTNTSDTIEKYLQNFEPELSLFKKDEKGKIIDPYKLLPKIEIYDAAESIQDGTGAMRAYEDIMFGLRKGDIDALEKYKTALLRYCKLDTLAMVIIWKYWAEII